MNNVYKQYWWFIFTPLSLAGIFLFAALLLSTKSMAATQEDSNWYQVEVIIFSQQDLFNDERHRTDLKLAYPKNLKVLTPTTESGTAFSMLPKNELQLGGPVAQLTRAPGYRVLYHQAWRQAGLGQKDSPWVLIQGGKAVGEHHELEGSFRLVKNHYLHIQADIWKTKFIVAPAHQQASTPDAASNSGSAQFISEAESEQSSWPRLPPVYLNQQAATNTGEHLSQPNNALAGFKVNDVVLLQQTTRIKRNELTYLDHPSMGVIVQVTLLK